MLFVGTSIIHPSTEGVFLLCNILDLLIYSRKDMGEFLQFLSDENGKNFQKLYENDFKELISGVKNIPCIYVDISEMEDNGYRVLEDITNTDNLIIKNMPIAIICKEGSMEQIRLAAGYDCVKDILFAPIEPQQLKRRIAAYRSKISD